jgi:aminopeptidase N
VRSCVGALLCLLSAACGSATPAGEAQRGRLPPGVTPLHYEISVEPDARALSLNGRVVIDVEVQKPTDAITLNALELDIASAKLDAAAKASVTLDPAAQTATLRFERAIDPGRHALTLDYRGRIETTPAGFFAVDYDTPAGPRRMLAAQFEVADARRFAPMWDEPAAKATFALEVLVPQGESAWSNMPVESTRVEGGKQRIRFATTPKMSSYLLYLTVGELERISRTVAGVDVGVVTRKGAGSYGRYALDAAVETLPWFNEYFGTPYPLPKLDMIAVPGSSQFFTAMENWGAILYFEPALLVDPRLSSHSDRLEVFATVAHEVAHQWFGDLVTMAWWDDLWLNEGFATWMELKTETALHPDRKPLLEVMNESRESALRRDAGAATHPVVQPVPSVDAASQAFDEISYHKGSAVVRMLEDTLGEAGFRAGIRRYMQRYAYGNATTDQLWAELAAATGRPVTEIAHDFTLQPGVPLVSVETAPCAAGRTPVTLTQGRFETGPKSAQRVTWRIPVRLRSVANGESSQVLFDKDGAPLTTRVAGCGPVIVNAGQAGYFRTRYTPADLSAFAEAFAAIPEVDRLGLLQDTWALGEAGELPVTGYLQLAQAVGSDSDPSILMQITDTVVAIDKLFDGTARQSEWRAFARGRLQPVFAPVGWLPADDESEATGRLREDLIRALGRFEDPAVVAEARSRFARAPDDSQALPAAIREATIEVVARHADIATWSELLSRARAASEPIEKQRLFEALGRAADPALASRALTTALEDGVPKTFAAAVIAATAEEHPRLAFDFALAHEKAMYELVEAASRWSFIPELARTSADPALARAVGAYAQRSVPPDARADAETAIADITFRADVKARQLPALDAWMRRYAGMRAVSARNSAAKEESAREIERICALPEAERQAQLEKAEQESGVVIYCGNRDK